MTTDLSSYIQQLRAQNTSDATIKKTLIDAGWDEAMVNDGLSGKSPVPPPPPPPNGKPVAKPQTGMWDAFEHILMFISLYGMTLALSFLIHIYIDKWFPGVSASGTRQTYDTYDTFRTFIINCSLATLLVNYPLFAFFHLNIKHRTFQNPVIRSLPSRKFLIYFTLVVTFLIAVGNVINAIFQLLSGNITSNFLMHLGTTLVIAGIVFVYYLLQVMEDRKNNV